MGNEMPTEVEPNVRDLVHFQQLNLGPGPPTLHIYHPTPQPKHLIFCAMSLALYLLMQRIPNHALERGSEMKLGKLGEISGRNFSVPYLIRRWQMVKKTLIRWSLLRQNQTIVQGLGKLAFNSFPSSQEGPKLEL